MYVGGGERNARAERLSQKVMFIYRIQNHKGAMNSFFMILNFFVGGEDGEEWSISWLVIYIHIHIYMY